MANSDTLMAYLIPRLTVQVENAATEALGYILNRSTRSMQALNDLLHEGGFDIEPITRVETQVTYEDGSRPDMAGYDKDNVKRLLVEANSMLPFYRIRPVGTPNSLTNPVQRCSCSFAPKSESRRCGQR